MARRVLVVEDEPLIRLGLVATLEDAGFTALEAAGADEAIALLERDPRVELVVTDVDMPGTMDGVKLAHYVRSKWPPIQLIVMSGKVDLASLRLPSTARFIAKPYQERHLLRIIDEMLPTNPGA